jgi:hypothetical protein
MEAPSFPFTCKDISFFARKRQKTGVFCANPLAT